MKKSLLNIALTTSLLASSAFVATQAVAVEGLSANATITSNYLWRGATQTDNGAAVQGGIDYVDRGFYVGTWISNVDGGSEADFYAGFSQDINENFSYDLGYIYYSYFDLENSDFDEIYANISFVGVTLGTAVTMSSSAVEDFSAGDNIYVSADYDYEFSNGLAVNVHGGLYTIESAADDAIDFGASISKSGFALGVSKLDDGSDSNSEDIKMYASYTMDFDL